MVNPGAYRWSSYPANALGKRGFDYDWLLPHPLYEALGRDADSRRQAYRRLFRAAMKETDLKAIRESLHQGWALGDDRFRDEIALLSERRAALRPYATGDRGKTRDDDINRG